MVEENLINLVFSLINNFFCFFLLKKILAIYIFFFCLKIIMKEYFYEK